MFSNAQEREQINEVMEACKNKRVWLWIVLVNQFVMQHLEHMRRWGMICGHAECNRRRKDGERHVVCPRNGRRLKEAWEWVQLRMEDFKERAKSITLLQCEGSNEIWNLVKNMNRSCASELRTQFKHYGIVPWALVNADTVEGAADCVRQIQARPIGDHDPVVQAFVAEVGQDLQVRAAGGELTSNLEHMIKRFEDAMLNEQPGEGVHRETTLEKHRAPASAVLHVKQKVRMKGVIKDCRSFIRKYGKQGRTVFRFEWRNIGRILQTVWKKRWTPKKMKFRAFMHRLYHQDEQANENWTSILTRIPENRPVVTVAPSNRDQLQKEYYVATLVPHTYYSISHNVSTPQEDGRVRETMQTDYFYLINTCTSRSREHVLHTVASADDPQATEPFVVEVNMLDRWFHPDVPDDGVIRVHQELDATWLVPGKIASWNDWSQRLWRYGKVEPDSDHAGCLVLSDAVKAIPTVPLLDAKCPSIVLVAHLLHNGWVDRKGAVEHTELLPIGGHLPFDGREATTKNKYYYQALLALPKILPLCGGRLPSVHPQAFYRLLLRGEAVAPGESATYYTNLWNFSRKTSKKEVIAIEDEPGLAPIADDEQFFPPAPGQAQPKPRPRTPGGPQRTDGTRGRESGTGRGGGGGGGDRPGSSGDPLLLPPPGPPGPEPGPPGPGGDADDFFPEPCVEPGRQALAKRKDKTPWVDGIGGVKVYFDPYVSARGVPEPNWQALCERHLPGTCKKRRGCTKEFEKHHGIIEPLAFVHVWESMAWPTKPGVPTHAREMPSQAAVDRFVAEHHDELVELCGRCGRT